MLPAQINYWAVLVCAVVAIFIDTLWYSPRVFGRHRLASLRADGATRLSLNTMTRLYLNTFLAFLVMSYILAHFVDYVAATTVVEGMVTGVWIWLGFVATAIAINSWFEKRPLRWWLINAGFYLVALAVTGAILAVWA